VSPASPSPEKSTYRDDRLANTAPPGRDQDVSSRCGFRSPCRAGLRLTRTWQNPAPPVPIRWCGVTGKTPGRAARGPVRPSATEGDRAGELTPSEAPAADRPRRRVARATHPHGGDTV